MATDHTHERDSFIPLREGEFQRIPGIGPGIAQRLHTAGIQTFRHLASLSPEEINLLLNGLVGMTADRIAHQDWPGKAQKLAQELSASDPSLEPEEPPERQHYASFMVELLQDENYVVRRTRVIHVQDDEKESWAGWDGGRLDRWITIQAAISPAPDALPAAVEPITASAKPPKTEQQPPSLVIPYDLNLGGIVNPGHNQPLQFLTADQSFEIHLTINPRTANLSLVQYLYRATAYAQPLEGSRFQVAEICGRCADEGASSLNIHVDGLKEGTYRLETVALVYPENAVQPEKEGRYAFSEGLRIHIYSPEAETTS